MSPEKEISKRQARREKMRQQAQRQRMLTIGLIIIGALLVVSAVVWQQVKPIAAIVTAGPQTHVNANRNSMGDPNAPIKLEEFSDFQCPFCERFHKETEPLLVQYYVSTGKVYFTYRSMGNWVSGNIGGGKTESQDAAMAAYCAADQNKFWDMNALLFANALGEDAGSFTSRRLAAIAENAALNMDEFSNCYSSDKYKDQVQKDFNDGLAAGVQGTPAFRLTWQVNGETKTKLIDGAQPFNVFQQELEAILQQVGQ